jgi:hypothetical protein
MENIKTTDADEKLEMLNYVDCDNDSPDSIKSQRGIVIDKVDKTQIVGSFGYTNQYIVNEKEEIETVLGLIENWNFFYSIEATLIRIANINEKWYIMTHKKLDAFKSRWSCKDTFGDLFESLLARMMDKPKSEKVLDSLYSVLDKNKVYCFLLKSNFENRIVCQYNYKNDKIVYLGCFEKGTIVNLDTSIPSMKEFELFAKPEQVLITSVEDLFQKVEAINCFEYQGIIACNKESLTQVRIFNQDCFVIKLLIIK